MLKYIILFLAAAFFLACAGQPITVEGGYGQPTKLSPARNVKQNETYYIKTIMIQIKNLEINLNKHEYHIYPGKFENFSTGMKYHIGQSFSWFVVDAAAGFKLTETDRRNKWLARSPILADVSFSAGIRKAFDNIEFELLYTLQHLSVPWRDDRGLNYDKVCFGVIIPF